MHITEYVTVVGNYINTILTYIKQLLNRMETHKVKKSREAVNKKSFFLITCKLVIRKKLVNNPNLNKKVVFIVFI